MPNSNELQAALARRRSRASQSFDIKNGDKKTGGTDAKSTQQSPAKSYSQGRPRRQTAGRRDSVVIAARSSVTDEKGRISVLDKLRKRTKNRKKAKYISRNKEVIKQLLKDMTAKSKFGKMLSYSLTCLTNLCVDEVSCEEMVDLNVLDVVSKVLRKNAYNEGLQILVNKFVKKLGINPAMRRLVAEKFSGTPIVNSLENHLGGETLASTCDTACHIMNEKLATKLTKQEIIPAIANVLHRNNNEQKEAKTRDPLISGAIAQLTSKLIGSKPEISEMIIKSGIADELMRSLELHPKDQALSLAAMTAIKQIAENDPRLGEMLKKRGVVGVLVRHLELHPDNEVLLKCGSEALKHLGTASELEKALEGLSSMDGGAMATIGALSLVGKNVEFLIKNGGIQLITGLLRDLSENKTFDVTKDENAKRFVMNGCRALERLAVDDANIYALMKEKCGQVLLDVVRKCYKDPEVAAAAYSALAAFSSRPENADYLVKLGTLPSVMALARSFGTKDANLAKKSMKLMAALCKTKEIGSELIKQGCLQQAVVMAKAHPDDKEVQVQALKFIREMIKKNGDEALDELAKNGGLETIVKALHKHGDDPEVAKLGLQALEKACSNKAALAKLRACGALGEVLNMLKIHKGNKQVVQLASRVVGNLLSEKDVRAYLQKFEGLVQRVKDGDKDAIPEMVELTNLLAGIASVEQNRALMTKCGLLEHLDRGLEVVQALPESEEKEAILRNMARTVALIAQEPEAAQIILKRGLHKRLLELAIKRKDEEMASSAVEMFSSLAEDPLHLRAMEADGSLLIVKSLGSEFEDSIIVTSQLNDLFKSVAKAKGGNVKDAVNLSLTALGNEEDPEKIDAELHYLINLSGQDGAIAAMAELGVVASVIDIIQDHSGNANVQKSAVALLQKLADEDEDILLAFCKEGGIDVACRAIKKLFNVENSVQDEIVLLARCAGNKENLEFFVKSGMANARLIAWATKAYPDNRATQSAGVAILTALRDRQEQQYLLMKKKEEELLQAAANERDEKMKGAGGKVTLEDLQYVLQGLDPNNPDMEAFEGLIAIVGNPENSDIFVEAGGMDFMESVLLGGENLDDETFNAAVMCFDSALGNMDAELISVVGDEKAMDMMMQVLNPKRAGTLNWDNLGNTLRAVVTMTEDSVVLNGMLKRGDLKGALMMISGDGTDDSCLLPAMKTLARISNQPDEMKKFANPENLKMLLEAMRRNMDKPEFLMYACYLLGNLACNQHIQNLIGELGGVQVIGEIMKRYHDRADVLEKCCYALRGLSQKNTVNCGLMSRYEIPHMTLRAMAQHSDQGTRFWINTVRLLLNLCKQGQQYAIEIQKNEGDMRLIEVIYSNTDDDAVVKFCCRVLERLATRTTYLSILENSVIHALNPALSKGEEHAESVVACMKVIDRLAQFSRTNPDAMAIFISENAHKAVVTCVKQHRSNPSIMTPAVKCLTQLSHDDHCSSTIVRRGVVEVVKDALNELAYDESFCKSAIGLIDRLSFNVGNISAIVESGVVHEMAETALTYIDSQSLVSRFLSSAGRICATKNYALKLAGDVIPAIARITGNYLEEPAMCQACFAALGSLTFAPQTARLLASKGSDLAMKAMKAHIRHVGLQRGILEFLSSLFLQSKAAEVGILETRVLAEVVKKLKNVDSSLLDNVLTVIYHAATSTNKVKDRMKADNVIQELKDTKIKYEKNEPVVQYCDKIIEAILTRKVDVSELNFEQTKKTDFIDSSVVWKEEKKVVDKGYVISNKLKNFLIAGMEIKWHTKKHGPLDTHLHVSKNLKNIVWTKGLGGKAKSMGTWRMRRVKGGTKLSDGDFGKKGGYKTKHPLEDRAFVVSGEDAILSFECPSEAMRNKWIKALEALKLHHKNARKLATDFVRDGFNNGY